MEALGERAESFFEKLAALPLDTMLIDTREALQALREVLTSPELKGAVAGTRRTTAALEPTIQEARLAIADARGLLQNMDSRLNGLAADSLVGEMRRFFGQVRVTLDSLNRTLANADETRLQATQAFLEIDRTMRSIRNLAEYFQTHPEAMLVGKNRERR
jgi:paraquat-inducible protein B